MPSAFLHKLRSRKTRLSLIVVLLGVVILGIFTQPPPQNAENASKHRADSSVQIAGQQQKKQLASSSAIAANDSTRLKGKDQHTPAATTSEMYYPVTSVIDGDTLQVTIDGEKKTVRLIGIDTPETKHPEKPQECFGKKASKKAESLLAGEKVRLEADASQSNKDRYGRLLRYVYLTSGTLFNEMMIQEGYGYEYTYNLPYKYQDAFKKAQLTAKENKRGLWAPDACEETSESETETKESGTETQSKPTNPEQRECGSNAYDCGDFADQSSAQETFEYCGGPAEDPHRLDADEDGRACEGIE